MPTNRSWPGTARPAAPGTSAAGSRPGVCRATDAVRRGRRRSISWRSAAGTDGVRSTGRGRHGELIPTAWFLHRHGQGQAEVGTLVAITTEMWCRPFRRHTDRTRSRSCGPGAIEHWRVDDDSFEPDPGAIWCGAVAGPQARRRRTFAPRTPPTSRSGRPAPGHSGCRRLPGAAGRRSSRRPSSRIACRRVARHLLGEGVSRAAGPRPPLVRATCRRGRRLGTVCILAVAPGQDPIGQPRRRGGRRPARRPGRRFRADRGRRPATADLADRPDRLPDPSVSSKPDVWYVARQDAEGVAAAVEVR